MPKEPKVKYSDEQIQELLKGLYDGSIDEYNIPESLYLATAEYLMKAVELGFEDFEGKDIELFNELRENVYMFSAAKTFQQLRDIGSLMFDEDGNRVSINEFSKLGEERFDTWNDDWGRTEYNTAVASATTAVKWQEVEDNKDVLPVLSYSTIGDACDICAPLDGLTASVDDAIWNTLTPPNHFNCFKNGTKILTKNKWVNIETIKKGDLVISGGGIEQNVLGVHINTFDGELRQINIKKETISATKNHGFLTFNGWKAADDLTVNDILIQNIEGSFINKLICTINNTCVILTYLFMPIINNIRNFVLAFNTQIIIGQINIYKSSINKFITNTLDTFRLKKIKNNLLTFSKFIVIHISSFRFFIIRFNSFFISFFSYANIKHGVINFHSFRSIGARTSESRIRPLSNFFQFIRSIDFPFVIINPLQFYGFATLSIFEPVLFHKFRQNSIGKGIYFPHFIKGKHINKMSFVNGFTAGNPLNCFNSLFSFKLHSFFHRRFVLIKSIKNELYTGQIYNLSVNKDETYITNVCVVHNCLCVVTQHSDDKELTPKGEKNITFEQVGKEMDDTFKYNPGKEKVIFSEDHPYFQVPKEDVKFAEENFGLPIPEHKK